MYRQAVQTISSTLGLTKLPEQVDVLLVSAVCFQLIYLLGGFLSSTFLPQIYNDMPHKNKRVWKVKFVSLINAVVICVLSFPLLIDEYLSADKVFHYTEYSGNVYAIACGYFLWDIVYVIVQGQSKGFLVHGISCLTVFLFSMTPFLNYYGSVFLMFELSTPFLNIIYFLDKSGLSNSIYMVINGLLLLTTFFTVRIVFGLHMSYHTLESVLAVYHKVPIHLTVIYGAANVVLNLLNIYWFYKMVAMFTKRYQQKLKAAKKVQ